MTSLLQQPEPYSIEGSEECFSFGTLKTLWKTLDGDGERVYLPQHIHSYYLPAARELPEELQDRREHIRREQEHKKAQGRPFFWNGQIYELDRFVIGRDAAQEDMTLDLWFRPSDYYTFLTTNMSLNDPLLREKYVRCSSEKLLQRWKNGVRDTFENQRLFPVPFTPNDVVSFASSHQPFIPGPALYYALVHEFGRTAVEEALEAIPL
jgi:hypothetical protein